METEMLRQSIRKLIFLYEKRIMRFLELMARTDDAFRSETEDYGKSLVSMEDAVCRQEMRRRELLLSEASVTAEKILGTSEVDPLYVNRNVVDIGFDESAVFDELRRHGTIAEKKTVSVKRLLDPLVGVKVKNEAAERLIGKIRAWASAEFVKELSAVNKTAIEKEGTRVAEEFHRGLCRHYSRVTDYYLELLENIPAEAEELLELIRTLEACRSEADIIEKSELSLSYTVRAVPDGICFDCEREYGRLRYIAVASPAYIVPMFPYTNDEFDEVFPMSFPDHLESDEKHTVSWAGSPEGTPTLKYVYPVARFSHNTVVFPPRYIGDLASSGSRCEADYTLEGSMLTVRDIGGYGFENMLFVTDEEHTVADPSELGEHPAMKAMLCRRDGKTGNFVIPLGNGIHTVSLIGIDRNESVAVSLPQMYIGERIPVMYSVETKRSRAVKNSCDIVMWFMIGEDCGFERFFYKKLPGIVIRCGEYAPLTKDQGRLVAEANNIVFTEEKGSFRAKYQTTVSGVDPKYDKLSVFFKEPTDVYQLKKV